MRLMTLLSALLACLFLLAGCGKNFTIEPGAFTGPFIAVPAAGTFDDAPLATFDTDGDGVPDAAISQYLYEADGNTTQRGMFNFAPYWASDTSTVARGGGINPSIATSGGNATTTSDESGDSENRIDSDNESTEDDDEVEDDEPE